MGIAIDSHSGVPVYRQIVDQVRFQVVGGILAPGDELPSTRTLSHELGINPMTVSKAYSLLESEGLVERHPGLPLRVRALPGERARMERRAQLEALLAPVAVAARQLGMDVEEATELFRRALVAATTEGGGER